MAFWFNGISSDDKGVTVEKYPDYVCPAKKMTKAEAVGRCGTIYMDNKAFNNVSQTYEVYIHKNGQTLETVANGLAEWLLSPSGYCRLTDSYNPTTYRMAVFSGPISIKNTFNKFGRASLKFDCDPRRWLVSGNNEVTVNGSIQNTTPFTSFPLVKITFTDADQSVEFSNSIQDITINAPDEVSEDGETFIFDSSTGMITDSEGSCRNSDFFIEEFLELPNGTTTITPSSQDIVVKITPRYYTL